MREFYHRVRTHPHLQRRPGIAQFIKFSIVGASNTLIDFSVFYLFFRTFHFHYLAANVLSFCVAVSWSFLINRRWTFRHQGPGHRQQFFKFFSVALVGLGLTSLLLFLFVDGLGVVPLVGKMLAVIIVLFWNFSANRLWTFRPKPLAE